MSVSLWPEFVACLVHHLWAQIISLGVVIGDRCVVNWTGSSDGQGLLKVMLCFNVLRRQVGESLATVFVERAVCVQIHSDS